MKFYCLREDMAIPDRWYVGSAFNKAGEEIAPERFRAGTPIDHIDDLHFSVQKHGRELDFSLSAFAIPLIVERLATRLVTWAGSDIQLVPARVIGSKRSYFVLNMLHLVDCLDEQRSGATFWPNDDPDVALRGTIAGIVAPYVDPIRAGTHRLFRLSKWNVPIMAAEGIADVVRGGDGVVLRAA